MDLLESQRKLLESIVDLLDIPLSYYQKAKQRAQSLEDWLVRDASSIRLLRPDVYPQGSFRYGTVIRPIFREDEYDLDLVCAVQLSKTDVSQEQVKKLLGREVLAYSQAKQFKVPPEEKHRCWRLDYADGVSFHMDILPCVPEDERTIAALVRLSFIPIDLAQTAVAITDDRHPRYRDLSFDWPSSNPRGFARWFESAARTAAEARLRLLVEQRLYASVDEVPPYDWKTPLQRSIQILKRHRDAMFLRDRTFAPISMIITTLAARAYRGEQNLAEALPGILCAMPSFISPTRPRIPNPVNPAEDFADAWSRDSQYEHNFRLWHVQASADLEQILSSVEQPRVLDETKHRLGVELRVDQLNVNPAAVAVASASAPVYTVSSAPRPWGQSM